MTLARSDIMASVEDMERFSTDLERLSVGALWADQQRDAARRDEPVQPKPQAIGHVWHWRDLRTQALKAAQLVGTQQAERRVLQLRNPGVRDRSATTNTLFAGIQIVMPGE